MSDSHVNDIRYTALWRPVVKAREAPAATPSLPLCFPHRARSVLFLSFRRLCQRYSIRVLLVLSLTSLPAISVDDSAGSSVVVGTRATANSICSDGKRDESIRSLREGRPQQLCPVSLLRHKSTATVRTIECDVLPLSRGCVYCRWLMVGSRGDSREYLFFVRSSRNLRNEFNLKQEISFDSPLRRFEHAKLFRFPEQWREYCFLEKTVTARWEQNLHKTWDLSYYPRMDV